MSEDDEWQARAEKIMNKYIIISLIAGAVTGVGGTLLAWGLWQAYG